ncbi:MAG: SsrA-binding protein SmpB [Eggerthellaceae bacterium]|nr:SsrA-binding protein SmpB [Eggerthellaceae bacterium]
MSKKQRKLVANNKKAYHDFFIEDTYEAGIELTGTEIKSVRAGKVSIKESFAKVTKRGEVVVYGMHIAPYEQGNRYNVDPLRERRLLLHRKEIRKIAAILSQEGLTLIPLQVYINEAGRCKVELGIARGKTLYAQREANAKRDAARKMERLVRK